MTALHRVKAYFGMVPVDDLDAYDGYEDHPRYGDADRRDTDRRSRYERGHESYETHGARGRRDREDESHYAYAGARHHERTDDRDDRADRYEASDLRPRTPRPRDPESVPDAEPVSRPTSRGRSWAVNTGPNHTSVRGLSGTGGRSSSSLAAVGGSGGSDGAPATAWPTAPAAAPAASLPTTSGSTSTGLGGATRGALAMDESRRRERTPAEEPVAAAPSPATSAPAEIVTLRPTSYNEARIIGERYRDGIPVIINLTELDDVAAKRLVDFAAGLAFALRGSIEKVTNRVFLLSPPNVEVSATDRRKLAEHTLSSSS